MKVRDGFVSNSSSTCWVLDIRQDGVKELVDKCKHVAGPGYLDRCTALAQGKGVKWYAKDWIEAVSDYGDDYRGLGHWILEWAEKIGVDNIVFMRESDEGMGGYLPCDPFTLALSSMEYH